MLNGFAKGEQYKHVYCQMHPVGVHKPVCDKAVTLPVVDDHKRAEEQPAEEAGIIECKQRDHRCDYNNNDGYHRLRLTVAVPYDQFRIPACCGESYKPGIAQSLQQGPSLFFRDFSTAYIKPPARK